MTDKLILGGHEFTSRFILGSGKYSLDLINAAVQNAGAEIITLALRRANQGGTGWLICNAEGTTVYCEMRVVDPADNAATGVGNYLRIANIGSQQLQARVVTSYYGLSLDFISQNTVLLGSN